MLNIKLLNKKLKVFFQKHLLYVELLVELLLDPDLRLLLGGHVGLDQALGLLLDSPHLGLLLAWLHDDQATRISSSYWTLIQNGTDLSTSHWNYKGTQHLHFSSKLSVVGPWHESFMGSLSFNFASQHFRKVDFLCWSNIGFYVFKVQKHPIKNSSFLPSFNLLFNSRLQFCHQ